MFLFLSLTVHAEEITNNKLIYKDEFVGYLANRLASQALLTLNLENKPENIRFQFQEDLYNIYFYRLLSCDGPLPKIEKAIGSYKLSPDKKMKAGQVLKYIGNIDKDVWPIVHHWNKTVYQDVVDTFTLRKPGPFMRIPDCVVQGYKGKAIPR